MIKTQYVTSDGQVFSGPYGEQNAKDHEECIPHIKNVRDFLILHFGDVGSINMNTLAANLVETDLAMQLTLVLRKAKVL